MKTTSGPNIHPRRHGGDISKGKEQMLDPRPPSQLPHTDWPPRHIMLRQGPAACCGSSSQQPWGQQFPRSRLFQRSHTTR